MCPQVALKQNSGNLRQTKVRTSQSPPKLLHVLRPHCACRLLSRLALLCSCTRCTAFHLELGWELEPAVGVDVVPSGSPHTWLAPKLPSGMLRHCLRSVDRLRRGPQWGCRRPPSPVCVPSCGEGSCCRAGHRFPLWGVHGLPLFCRFSAFALLVLLVLGFALFLLSLLLDLLHVLGFALLFFSLFLVFAFLGFFPSFALRLCVRLLRHGLHVLLPTVGCFCW